MEPQDKGLKHIGNDVESKEGERKPLSCNKANVRSPSLDFNPNSAFMTEKMQLDYLAEILVDIFLEQRNK